jgi:Prolyl oligopeptidase family
MTAEAVRDTPFAKWKDPDAWMEAMKGPKWRAVLQEEATVAKQVHNHPAVQSRVGLFKAMMDMARDLTESTHTYHVGPANIAWHSEFFKTWSWVGSQEAHEARDCFPAGDLMVSVQDVSDGAEQFQLQVWGPKLLWTLDNVGPTAGVLRSTLFYLKMRNKLQYYQLWCCDLQTGSKKTLLYEISSKEENCSLERLSDGRLFFQVENAQDYTTFELSSQGVLLKRKEKYTIPSNWILPLLREYGVDFLWPKHGFLVTRQQGSRTLWKISPKTSAKKLLHIPVGTIQFDPWAVHLGQCPCTVQVSEPAKNLARYKLTEEGELQLLQPIVPTPLVTERFESRSKDGTAIFGCITKMKGIQPIGLVVIGYGAYGVPTATGSVYQRWTPLVKRGWAVVHTFLRGGGDHTDAWAKAGRRSGRVHTVDDFVALVSSAQLETGVGPRQTVIYGRSAGGLVMGESLHRFPNGSLFSAVYTEVPYVDELRTTTNPSLPLTTMEYNEFGAPAMRLEDFIHVGQTSPADSAFCVCLHPNS